MIIEIIMLQKRSGNIYLNTYSFIKVKFIKHSHDVIHVLGNGV